MSDAFIDVASPNSTTINSDSQSQNKISSDQVKNVVMDAYFFSQTELNESNKIVEVFMRLFNAPYFFITQAYAKILLCIFYEKVPVQKEVIEEAKLNSVDVSDSKVCMNQEDINDLKRKVSVLLESKLPIFFKIDGLKTVFRDILSENDFQSFEQELDSVEKVDDVKDLLLTIYFNKIEVGLEGEVPV